MNERARESLSAAEPAAAVIPIAAIANTANDPRQKFIIDIASFLLLVTRQNGKLAESSQYSGKEPLGWQPPSGLRRHPGLCPPWHRAKLRELRIYRDDAAPAEGRAIAGSPERGRLRRNHAMRRVQVLGPGCPNCDKLLKDTQTAVSEMGIDAVVEKVSDIDAIIELGALMTPALAVDGEIRMVGIVPPIEELKKLLE
jgi:small redox-active disulfide protein 2